MQAAIVLITTFRTIYNLMEIYYNKVYAASDEK